MGSLLSRCRRSGNDSNAMRKAVDRRQQDSGKITLLDLHYKKYQKLHKSLISRLKYVKESPSKKSNEIKIAKLIRDVQRCRTEIDKYTLQMIRSKSNQSLPESNVEDAEQRLRRKLLARFQQDEIETIKMLKNRQNRLSRSKVSSNRKKTVNKPVQIILTITLPDNPLPGGDQRGDSSSAGMEMTMTRPQLNVSPLSPMPEVPSIKKSKKSTLHCESNPELSELKFLLLSKVAKLLEKALKGAELSESNVEDISSPNIPASGGVADIPLTGGGDQPGDNSSGLGMEMIPPNVRVPPLNSMPEVPGIHKNSRMVAIAPGTRTFHGKHHPGVPLGPPPERKTLVTIRPCVTGNKPMIMKVIVKKKHVKITIPSKHRLLKKF